ncbi:hypothetical protein HUJ04_011393 [Dendroctonus ponderosae]|nr:hypothetical protein HUJ04_011393 [Dendroctonus ponderosae]KAH1028584.1 hypothetical protein HUJ05_001925 [Dendroctonus ponderosae]
MDNVCILQRKMHVKGHWHHLEQLSAFFSLSTEDLFPKTLLYSEVATYYTWDASTKKFQRRKQDDQLKVHSPMHRLALPSQIRTLFVIWLTTCFPSNPKDLWENYKDYMSEDILHRLPAANQNPELQTLPTHVLNMPIFSIVICTAKQILMLTNRHYLFQPIDQTCFHSNSWHMKRLCTPSGSKEMRSEAQKKLYDHKDKLHWLWHHLELQQPCWKAGEQHVQH